MPNATLDIEMQARTAAPTPKQDRPAPPSIRLGHALASDDADALPSVIRDCREVVIAARANALPVAEGARDANARIYILANDLFLAWERREAHSAPQTRTQISETVKELRRWSEVLTPVLDAQRALDAAMSDYRARAPRRERER